MSITTELTDTVQEQVIGTLEQVQAFVLDAVRNVADAVQPLIPELPELPAELPTPGEVVDTGFTFAKKVLDLQHTFVRDVVAATVPAPSSASAGKAAS